MDNVNFDYVLIKILKKERHFLHTVFCKDFESAIRLTNFQFWKFDLIWQYDLRNVAVVDGNIDLRPFLAADLDSWGQNWYSIGWTVRSQNFDLILRFFTLDGSRQLHMQQCWGMKMSINTPSIIRRTGMKTRCLRVVKYKYDQFRQCETSTMVDYINMMQKMPQKCRRLSPYELNYAK